MLSPLDRPQSLHRTVVPEVKLQAICVCGKTVLYLTLDALAAISILRQVYIVGQRHCWEAHSVACAHFGTFFCPSQRP